jgi:hypothetical protein
MSQSKEEVGFYYNNSEIDMRGENGSIVRSCHLHRMVLKIV